MCGDARGARSHGESGGRAAALSVVTGVTRRKGPDIGPGRAGGEAMSGPLHGVTGPVGRARGARRTGPPADRAGVGTNLTAAQYFA